MRLEDYTDADMALTLRLETDPGVMAELGRPHQAGEAELLGRAFSAKRQLVFPRPAPETQKPARGAGFR